jgi:hypothetical protein
MSEQVPSFSELTLMVTGASGGMVGASYWLANQWKLHHEQDALGWEELMRLASGDSLTALTRALVIHDVPHSFVPCNNPNNRGAAMQSSWEAAAREKKLDLRRPLSEFRAGEAAGKWPSLVFSPMLVEDGRRLIFSNLMLTPVLQSEARWVNAETNELVSDSAFHAVQLLHHGLQIRLATAARLSATFPYISPAVLLPTEPRTRIVDAGYYDNYGVDLATTWLREALRCNRDWLAEHCSGILVLQIRDDESTLADSKGKPQVLPPEGRGPFAWLGRGLEGLTTPLQGLAMARGSAMQLRNDAQLEAISHAYDAALGDGFVVQETFELKAQVSLSWYLSSEETERLRLQVCAIEPKLQRLADWVLARRQIC